MSTRYHTSRARQMKLALAAWPEIPLQFISNYTCRLNLIKPWWKQMHSPDLKGKRFDDLDRPTLDLN
jgi:hypothetical protein